jgi:adenine-specific DNA-methyltransferase
MSKYNELVTKLREIFQIDRPELDFGIYRILNARAGEINRYLDEAPARKSGSRRSARFNAAQPSPGGAELKDKEAQYFCRWFGPRQACPRCKDCAPNWRWTPPGQ